MDESNPRPTLSRTGNKTAYTTDIYTHHVYTLIFFEIVEEADEVWVLKARPQSELPRHELVLVVARRSNAVDDLHGDQLEISTRIQRLFHLYVAQCVKLRPVGKRTETFVCLSLCPLSLLGTSIL